MRTANFFDDDYGNIEIVPAENLVWCGEQQEAIDRFSEAHRDGIGWSKMYVRPEVPVPLAARGISKGELHEVIASQLPPFDRITCEHEPLGDSSRIAAYGPHPDVVVFATLEGELVKELWGTLQPDATSHVTAAAAGLQALAKWNLILVDWGWSCVIPLDDPARLAGYLSERLRVFGAPAPR